MINKSKEKQVGLDECSLNEKADSRKKKKKWLKTLDDDLFNGTVPQTEEEESSNDSNQQAQKSLNNNTHSNKIDLKTENQNNRNPSMIIPPTENAAIKSIMEAMEQLNEKLDEIQKTKTNDKSSDKKKNYDTKHISVNQLPRILTFKKTENELFKETLRDNNRFCRTIS